MPESGSEPVNTPVTGAGSGGGGITVSRYTASTP
jgi:hypothetical protein